MKIAVLGLGGRGVLYTDIIIESEADCKIVAVCDVKEDKRKMAHDKYGVSENMIFSDENDFFAKGKIADILIIATMDKAHYRESIKALSMGYDVLLEKPMSPDENECREIIACAEKYNRKIAICHVLRYTPVYSYIKNVVESGEIGEIINVSQTENVGYWHQAHSFVRGNWRDSNKTSPMILQKCCHDMDILRWIINKPCLCVSSFGELTHFKKENAPYGAADRCVDCEVKDCIYNAVDFYKREPGWFALINNGITDVEEALKILPNGRCVYRCDNNVVDHQVVNLLFDGGVTAQLTMSAFSDKNYRYTHIYGTKGEIETTSEFVIKVTIFGKGERIIDVKGMGYDLSGHGGGDKCLIHDFINYCKGNGKIKSSAQASLESHLMAFSAERSRINGGRVEKIEI